MVLLVVLGIGVLLMVSALKDFWGARRKRGSVAVFFLTFILDAQAAERVVRIASRAVVFVIGSGLVALAALGLWNYLAVQRRTLEVPPPTVQTRVPVKPDELRSPCNQKAELYRKIQDQLPHAGRRSKRCFGAMAREVSA